MSELRRTIESAAISLFDDHAPGAAERRDQSRTARDMGQKPGETGAEAPDAAERARAWRSVMLGDLVGFLLVSAAALWSAAPLML